MWVLVLLPLVVVETAPACPDAALLTEALQTELGTSNQAVEHTFRLRVAPRDASHTTVTLLDDRGYTALVRDLSAPPSSCSAGAEEVAAIVERYLTRLALPARRPASPRARPRPPPRPGSRARLEARGGFALQTGIDGGASALGATLGLAAMPIRYAWIAIDVAAFLDSSIDHALVGSRGVRLVAGVEPIDSIVRVRAGVLARLDETSVEGRNLAFERRALVLEPALGVAIEAVLPLVGRLHLAVTVEAYRPLVNHELYVELDAGAAAVHRTPALGLRLAAVVGWDLWRR